MAAEEESAQAGEKRRHSTRIRRDSVAKRQAIEPEAPPPPKDTPKVARGPGRPRKEHKEEKPKAKARKSQVEAVEIPLLVPRETVLPVKVKDGVPMPTLDQAPDDAQDDFQTIKESGVLSAALARSRKRWVTEGVFDKYWTKPPPKKRGDPNSQPREKGKPGERIGSCTLTAEPHIFDINLFIVKETLPPGHPQYLQYAPPPPPQPPQPPPAPRQQYQTFKQPQNPPHQSYPPRAAPSHPHPHIPAPAPPPQQQQSQPDPVIHMLAQRASTNPELKAVMKIVATGSANQEQLDYFQRHIDELTRLSREQQKHHNPPGPPKPRGQPAQGNAYHGGAPAPPYGHANSFQHQPYHPPVHRPVHAAPPAAIRIKAILIEFALDPTSRFLFPANSILEYGPGFKSCTASFLIKRKVKDAEDLALYREVAMAVHVAAGKPLNNNQDTLAAIGDTEFWQPVTVRFACENGSILETFAKYVKDPKEVSAWMERALNGEPESPAKDAPPTSLATPSGEIKKESDAGNNLTPGGKQKKDKGAVAAEAPTKHAPGAFRAVSRKLAMRLPTENKGKENIEA